ncbi:hypothetical protein PF003_g28089 [Phytophthora fragariae]|nr:hypothetical protein PF003_g28089 [Phytophthora fragariae]
MATGSKRSLQLVVSLINRVKCVEWMEIDERLNGVKGLFGRAKRDPTRAKLSEKHQLKYASTNRGTHQQFVVKALQGRGRKLEAQWEWLYPRLLSEFERLRRAGVKFSIRSVMDMATVLVEDSADPVYNTALRIRGVPFREKITEHRIQDFMERFNIVYRRLKGNKQVSEENQLQIDISIVTHLGKFKRQFDDKTIDPDQIYSMD